MQAAHDEGVPPFEMRTMRKRMKRIVTTRDMNEAKGRGKVITNRITRTEERT